MGHAERYMRQAHNLKVVGSNPTPATKRTNTFLILFFNLQVLQLLILLL